MAATLSEMMRLLQDFGVFIVIVLVAYTVYKTAVLIEAIGDRIKGGKS
ncbi:MAG: hypothetical protein JSV64_00100 [Candidatus Bathyarchaeota archaeon]|jgi:hypothetical protein|nr:MAG: hypothetical protein JSV64_00100 [Candidatus Bathyarchaeota archaeon]